MKNDTLKKFAGTKLSLEDFERLMWAEGEPLGANLMEAFDDEIEEVTSHLYTQEDLDSIRRETQEQSWEEAGGADYGKLQEKVTELEADLVKERRMRRETLRSVWATLHRKGALDRKGLTGWVRSKI